MGQYNIYYFCIIPLARQLPGRGYARCERRRGDHLDPGADGRPGPDDNLFLLAVALDDDLHRITPGIGKGLGHRFQIANPAIIDGDQPVPRLQTSTGRRPLGIEIQYLGRARFILEESASP